jgi:hypothetical protein
MGLRVHALYLTLGVPDYFLIVDADEVWEAGDPERLFSHAGTRRGLRYRAGAVRCFRSGDTRIETKVASFGHAHGVRPGWLEDVCLA